MSILYVIFLHLCCKKITLNKEDKLRNQCIIAKKDHTHSLTVGVIFTRFNLHKLIGQ